MTRCIRFTIVALIAIIVASCGKSDRFVIKGRISGIGSQTLALTYYAAGGLKRVKVPASDGRVTFDGVSVTPTLATVTLADGTPIATLVVKNGDKVSFTTNVDDPLSLDVSGNSASEKIAAWLRDNAHHLHDRDARSVNESIARFVAANKSSTAATALMVTQFRTEGFETLADSLFSLIDVSARPASVVQNFSTVLSAQLSTTAHADLQPMNLYSAGDTITAYNPRRHSASLLCFLPDLRAARDSITPLMRRLARSYPSRRLKVIEISTAPDSAAWQRCIASDSATWLQTWAPGSVASTNIGKLAIPRLPYFIVADSTGAQIYRGPSISTAENTISGKLK